MRSTLIPLAALLAISCGRHAHDIAPDISAQLGEPLPTATADQRDAFDRGQKLARKRFDRSEGLGPGFNVDSCAACHERPVTGGAAGLYRNFFLHAHTLPDGTFEMGSSAGNPSGVIRLYYYGGAYDPRPAVSPADDILAQRNPIPFFGVGLLAELPEDEILKRADPDDKDGDGISGRPNYDRGFVGRFGMKAQTVSLEGFIRGPLNNHLGITSDPLTDDQRARLPVDSSQGSVGLLEQARDLLIASAHAQAAAPDAPLTDVDEIPDPELSGDDLFDLVSFTMLLAAPQFDEFGAAELRGQDSFERIGCDDCHTPRLDGPRGPLPVYSDLLLHDMGPDLADGIRQGDATGSEFRTMPLWGVSAEGPYLHDGRAGSLDAAIRAHAGEGSAARDRWADLSDAERADVIAFLGALGGRSQKSPGLLPPDAPVPAVGEYGGPRDGLDPADNDAFIAGRAQFDREYTFEDGLGNPRFNGDSCRACHFQAAVGGGGPRSVNVMRHALVNDAHEYVVPTVGTILHRETAELNNFPLPQPGTSIYEPRNTPPLFGMGLVEAIPEDEIVSHADPYDLDGDGISGEVSWTDGGRVGRFGWKADVPTLDEFARDAIANELGMTLPRVDGLTFGRIDDNDAVADPELGLEQADSLVAFMRGLGPPPRTDAEDPATAAAGEPLFAEVGCDRCHTPSLDGPDGPVPLYSDLLLHDVLPAGMRGIESASATESEFRTAPLWGLAASAPYLHDGAADTIAQAIDGHDGEAAASRDAFDALPPADRDALLAFLGTL